MASISKSTCALACAAVFMMSGVPAEAGKPTKPGGGGGDTSDPCTAAGLNFPAFSYVVPRYSKTTGYENEVRLSDASGACSILVQVVGGGAIPPAFNPILIELDGGWRLVWNDRQVGVTVLDFNVNYSSNQPPAIVVVSTTMIALPGRRATNLDEMPDGRFVYLERPDNPGSGADSIWLATLDGNTWRTTQLAEVDTSVRTVTDIAVSPDGQSIYYILAEDGLSIHRLPVAALSDSSPIRIGESGDPSEPIVDVPYSDFGQVLNVAAGSCSGIGEHTCLAIELHGPNTDPCVPHYYRTLAWDATASSPPDLATLEKLQLAKPSFTSNGELVGQLTGSTSKRACTAKIYDTMVRQSPFNPDAVTTLGTGQVPDAPF